MQQNIALQTSLVVWHLWNLYNHSLPFICDVCYLKFVQLSVSAMTHNANMASPPQSSDPILCSLPATWGWGVRGKGIQQVYLCTSYRGLQGLLGGIVFEAVR